MSETTRERVAVIGAGVAGLTAAYLLQRRYDVLLFEADPRLGGHAHTHDVPASDGSVAVDSGFIVHNERTYPNLLRLFGELGVATRESEMSMSVRCLGCGLEYAGARGLPGLFPARPTRCGRATCGCWPRSPGFTGMPDAYWPEVTTTAHSASSPPATPATSSSTSCCRSSRRSGRRRKRSAGPTRRGTCSRSSTTTGCCR